MTTTLLIAYFDDMVNPHELYRPWLIRGTVFSRMFLCGPEANTWLEHTMIHCFPIGLLDEWKDRLAFLSADHSDAFRVSRVLRESRELIVLSERIIPKPGMSEADPVVRYFIFATLHEVAHAIRQHRPPNEITPGENAAQEAEADEFAFGWFNDYLRERNHPDLPEFTREELGRAQAKNREAMQSR